MSNHKSKLLIYCPDSVAFRNNRHILDDICDYDTISLCYSNLSDEEKKYLVDRGIKLRKTVSRLPLTITFQCLISRLSFYATRSFFSFEMLQKLGTILYRDNTALNVFHLIVGIVLMTGTPLFLILGIVIRVIANFKYGSSSKSDSLIDYLSLNPTSRHNLYFTQKYDFRNIYSSLRNIDEISLKGPFQLQKCIHYSKWKYEETFVQKFQSSINKILLKPKKVSRVQNKNSSSPPNVCIVTVHQQMFPEQLKWISGLVSRLNAQKIPVSLCRHPNDFADYSKLNVDEVELEIVKNFDVAVSHSSTVCLEMLEHKKFACFVNVSIWGRFIHYCRNHTKIMARLGVQLMKSDGEFLQFLKVKFK